MSTSPGTTAGAAEDVERDTAGLRTGPAPLTDNDRQYAVSRGPDCARPRVPWGSRSFIKSHNADDVRPEALDELVELVATAPADGTFSVTALGGAIARVPEEATAYAGREANFDLSSDATWTDPVEDEAAIGWCRRAMDVVEPDRTLGAYPNGNSDAGPDETRRLYGDAKLVRLAGLKRTWDPDNVFHVNPNVVPGSA